jgi:hypothetical protein
MVEVSLLGDLIVNGCRECATAGGNVNCGICADSHRLLMFHQSKRKHQFTLSTLSYVPSYNTA